MSSHTPTSNRANTQRLELLERVREAAQEFEQAVALNMIAGGRVAPIEQAIRLLEEVRRTHPRLRAALDAVEELGHPGEFWDRG